jgi:hypothetical protein
MVTDDKTLSETADDGSNNEIKKDEAMSSDIGVANMTRMRRRMFGGYISHHGLFGILDRVERQGDRNDDAVSMIANPFIFHRSFHALSSLPGSKLRLRWFLYDQLRNE